MGLSFMHLLKRCVAIRLADCTYVIIFSKGCGNMEDKMFELMTRMYSEMKQGFANVDKRFADVDKRFDDIDKRFEDVDKRFVSMDNKIETLSKQVMSLENDLKPKVEAALDGYKLVYEKLTDLSEKVDIINSKVEKQDVEIRVIKSAK